MGPPKYHRYPLFCSSNIFYKCKLFSAKSLTSIQFPRLRNPITALYCNQAGKNLAVHQDETEHLLLNLIKHPRKKSLSGKKKKSFPLSGWEVSILTVFNNKNFNFFISVVSSWLPISRYYFNKSKWMQVLAVSCTKQSKTTSILHAIKSFSTPESIFVLKCVRKELKKYSFGERSFYF